MTLDLISALNKYQSKYEFNFTLTSPKRRYLSFQQGKFDLIMFESIDWRWQKLDIEASKVFLKGGEVYIALNKPGRGQEFFSNLKQKKIAGILGYHYGFAGFNADELFLRKEFNIHLTNDHEGSIKLILIERDDIAVVTQSFLSIYLIRNPTVKSKILISEKMDQKYSHTILVRKGSQPSVAEINQLLNGMKKQGVLQTIWEQYGLTDN